MTRLLPPLLAFTGGLLLGRFALPPALGWSGVLLTRTTLWSVALGCGAVLMIGALAAPAGVAQRFVAALARGGFLFVPLLFAGFAGVMALGEQIPLTPSTLSALSVLSPLPAYLIVAAYVFRRTAGARHA